MSLREHTSGAGSQSPHSGGCPPNSPPHNYFRPGPPLPPCVARRSHLVAHGPGIPFPVPRSLFPLLRLPVEARERMRHTTQLLLDAARRVAAFCDRHPDRDPATTAALDRLLGALAGAREAVETQRRGAERAAQALAEREQAAGQVRKRLPHLYRFLAAAAIEVRPPGRYESRTLDGVEGAARSALAVARKNENQLRVMGMPPTLLDELEGVLARHESARLARGQGLALRASATEALDRAAGDATQATRHLDAIFQVHLAADPTRLATWNAVRAIPWHRRRVEGGEESVA